MNAEAGVNSATRPTTWTVEQHSVRGRRDGNQDRVCSVPLGDDHGLLLVLADGMGNYAGGEEAARIAVETARMSVSSACPTSIEALRSQLPALYAEAAERLEQAAQRNPEWNSMGSTLTCVGLLGDRFVVSNLGDSRAYLLKQGGLVLLTRDHTLRARDLEANPAAEMGPDNAWRARTLTRDLGVGRDPTPDLFPMVEGAYTVTPGDLLLLASDGLHAFVTPEEIERTFAEASSLQQAVRLLEQRAARNGSDDNITLLVAAFGPRPAGRAGVPLRNRIGARPPAIPARARMAGSGLAMVLLALLLALRHGAAPRPPVSPSLVSSTPPRPVTVHVSDWDSHRVAMIGTLTASDDGPSPGGAAAYAFKRTDDRNGHSRSPHDYLLLLPQAVRAALPDGQIDPHLTYRVQTRRDRGATQTLLAVGLSILRNPPMPSAGPPPPTRRPVVAVRVREHPRRIVRAMHPTTHPGQIARAQRLSPHTQRTGKHVDAATSENAFDQAARGAPVQKKR